MPYTQGTLTYTPNLTCSCIIGFTWSYTDSKCEISCSTFNSSGMVGAMVVGTIDQCKCLNTS